MHSNDWEDFTKYDAAKRILLGGIIGGVYFTLYSDHNFPNSAMTFVSGYMGTDFIEKLVQKLQPEVIKKDEQ